MLALHARFRFVIHVAWKIGTAKRKGLSDRSRLRRGETRREGSRSQSAFQWRWFSLRSNCKWRIPRSFPRMFARDSDSARLHMKSNFISSLSTFPEEGSLDRLNWIPWTMSHSLLDDYIKLFDWKKSPEIPLYTRKFNSIDDDHVKYFPNRQHVPRKPLLVLPRFASFISIGRRASI